MPRGPSNLHNARYRKLLSLLKAARKDAGLTQVQVCTRLKKSQSWLSKSERGERRVDPTELEDLANLYKKDLDYFRTKRRH